MTGEAATGLRQRKSGLSGLVQDLDGFSKVVDDVKEEKRTTAGIISFLSFIVILILVFGEVHTHFLGRREFDYRFTVDTDDDERPPLKMDFVVATPCNALSVATTNDLGGGAHHLHMQQQITKDPTRFEFTDEEQLYWTILRHAHAKMNADGLRGLEEMEYVSEDVEEQLTNLADEKQEAEKVKIAEEAKKGRKNGDNQQIVFMVASGMGVFQMVATSSKDEGTACRIHGKLDVRKGKNEKILVSLSSGMGFHVHGHGGDDDKKIRNISHRIEQFNFGPRISGLVSPLAGAEQISESGHDVYRYFLKVVPTKIYKGLFGGYTMSYQYSLTFMKKKQDSVYSEGGIYFEYEFSATVIEIRERVRTLLHLLLRLCAIIGGVFATSSIINGIFHSLLHLFFSPSSSLPGKVALSHTHHSSTEQQERASLINPDILVR